MSIEARLATRLGEFELEVDFRVPARGVTALFGPSGAGKTTLLRCIAGLERAAGFLRVAGESWQEDVRGHFLAPHRRPIGYVFQEASLFEHLSVRRNLEFGWKRVPQAERRIPFDEVVDRLGIAHLLGRDPVRLSGGERQRVALARALLTSPRLLLMDEPLAALDHASRQEILPYLERLQRDWSIPVLYVSHAPDEVARLADRMLLLERGRVRAAGATTELLVRLDLPLAHADDAGALLQAVVASHDDRYQLSQLRFAGGEFSVPRIALSPGDPVRVRVHARDVSLALAAHQDSSILNIFPVRVLDISDAGPAQQLVRLGLQGQEQCVLLARITRKSADRLGLRPGQQLHAQVKSVALMG